MAEDFLIGVGKESRNTKNNGDNSSQQPPITPDGTDDNYSSKIKKNLKKGGCGCLSILLFLFLIGYCGDTMLADKENDDLRITYLQQDMSRLKSASTTEDPMAELVKQCVDIGVDSGGEINKDAIKYFTRINGEKLLVLLEVRDLKGIKASSRKVIVQVIEECLEYLNEEMNIKKYYIAVEGKWNTLLVKTPNGSDLGGKFADDKLLLPFYEEYVKDSLPSLD